MPIDADARKDVRLASLVDERVEAISLARAHAECGHTKDDVLAAINRKVAAGLCVILGQSDTHVIVAWDDDQPFVITINDYEKYVDPAIIAEATKAEVSHE